MVARGDAQPAEPGVPRAESDAEQCRDRAAQSASRRSVDPSYMLLDRGVATKDLRISQAEANRIIYDICQNYNGQGCANGGKPFKDKNDPTKTIREDQEGCCWPLSPEERSGPLKLCFSARKFPHVPGNRIYSPTNDHQNEHCAYECPIHRRPPEAYCHSGEYSAGDDRP